MNKEQREEKLKRPNRVGYDFEKHGHLEGWLLHKIAYIIRDTVPTEN